MQILDLSGMYFDAALVFVTKSSLLIHMGSDHTVRVDCREAGQVTELCKLEQTAIQSLTAN